MSSKSSLFKVLGLLLIAGMLNACGSKGDNMSPEEQEAESLKEMSVNLADVSSDKCLNLQKYFNAIKALPEETRVRKVTSDFNAKNSGNLPRNFYLRLAAGNFQIIDGNLVELPDITTVEQVGCEKVIFRAEGHQEAYKIVKATKDSLALENDWSGLTVYKWTSPLTMEITNTTVVADYLCNGDNRARVSVTHDISWGTDSIFTETLPEKAIEPAYLSLVSDATGFAFNSLYLTATPPVFTPKPIPNPPPLPEEDHNDDDVVPPFDGDIGPIHPGAPVDGSFQTVAPEQKLVVTRLKELQASSVRPDLLMCY
jgi:hypothetical protein